MKRATVTAMLVCVLAWAVPVQAQDRFEDGFSRMDDQAGANDMVGYDSGAYYIVSEDQGQWWEGASDDDGVLYAYDLYPNAESIQFTAHQVDYGENDGSGWNYSPTRSGVKPHSGIMVRDYVDSDTDGRPDGEAMMLSLGAAGGAYSDAPALARLGNSGNVAFAEETESIPLDHSWLRLSVDLVGNTGAVYSSSDGSSWTQLGDGVEFTGTWGDQLAAGLYIAGDYNNYAGGLYDNVQIDVEQELPVEISWDPANDRVVVEAKGSVALIKLESTDGAFAENGYTPCVTFSTVEQPDETGAQCGEFMTADAITGTGYAAVANAVGDVTCYYQFLGEDKLEGETVTIPEPATVSLLALGGLVAVRRRRRK